MIRLSTLIIILILSVGPIVSSGFLFAFIDIPSMALVLGVPFGLLLYCYGNDLFAFTWKAFLLSIEGNVEPNQRMSEIAMMGRKFVLSAGIICSVRNWIMMFQDLSDPSKIGVGMAVSLLGLIYAIACSYFVFMPLEVAFSGDVTGVPAKDSYTPPSEIPMLLRTLQLLVLMLCFIILLNVLAC